MTAQTTLATDTTTNKPIIPPNAISILEYAAAQSRAPEVPRPSTSKDGCETHDRKSVTKGAKKKKPGAQAENSEKKKTTLLPSAAKSI
jgi:hypothetical protein